MLHGGVGNPCYEDRMPGPNAPDLPVYQFFWDRGRAKEFYPQSSWFIDIATCCLRALSEPRMPIIVLILQRIISHLPMEREMYKLLLKYPLPASLPKLEADMKHEPECVKAFINIKQFMEVFFRVVDGSALALMVHCLLIRTFIPHVQWKWRKC